MEINHDFDNKVVDYLNQRNEDALILVQDYYGQRLRDISYRIIHNHSIVYECENDTYLAMWNSIPPNKPDNLFAFLAKIIRNKTIDRVRELNQKECSFELLDDDICESFACEIRTPEDQVQQAELLRIIQRELRHCSVQNRKIFVLRFWYGMTYQEIAERLNCSVTVLSSSLNRTRNRLKKALKKEGWIET